MAEWIVNLGEAAEYMFDHNIFQDNLVGVDFCEQMVKETNPKVLAKAESTPAPTLTNMASVPSPTLCGAQSVYRLLLSRSVADEPYDARDVLPDGRPPRSSLYSLSRWRRNGSDRATIHRLLVRLMKYVEFMKKVLPLHDDFSTSSTRLCRVRRSRTPADSAGMLGIVPRSRGCDYKYENMTEWGRAMYVTPGVVVDGKLVTTDLVDINLNIEFCWEVLITTTGRTRRRS